MPLESYLGQLEPDNPDVAIWRFLNMNKFLDLITSGELYFCRADLFADQCEGLPPRGYYPFPDLNPLDLRDRRTIDHSIGCLAQFREAFYVNCWHVLEEETCKMWEEYGQDGVAICSRYGLLKSALDAMVDRAYLGMVRYGSHGMNDWNLFRFIFTKRAEYAEEREVRALLWIMDSHAGINRHVDIDDRAHQRPLTPPPDRVLAGHRRKVDLDALITEIVIAPWAPSSAFDITQILKHSGHTIAVRTSALAHYKHLLPSPLLRHGPS